MSRDAKFVFSGGFGIAARLLFCCACLEMLPIGKVIRGGKFRWVLTPKTHTWLLPYLTSWWIHYEPVVRPQCVPRYAADIIPKGYPCTTNDCTTFICLYTPSKSSTAAIWCTKYWGLGLAYEKKNNSKICLALSRIYQQKRARVGPKW